MARNRQDNDFRRSTKDHLAKSVNYHCSKCGCPTSGPQKGTSLSMTIGVAAHISAASPKGPRYDPKMTPAQRRHYDNGIWMCANHGTLVDHDWQTYSVQQLREMKQKAEDRAAAALAEGHVQPKQDAVLERTVEWRPPLTNETRPGYAGLYHAVFTLGGNRKQRGRAYIEVDGGVTIDANRACISTGTLLKHEWRDLRPAEPYLIPVFTRIDRPTTFWLDGQSGPPTLDPGTYVTDEPFLSRLHRAPLTPGNYRLRLKLVLGDAQHLSTFYGEWLQIEIPEPAADLMLSTGGHMPSPATARGELPRFYELDPLRFQGLCRDLLQEEPDYATAEVYGVPGQLQRGVDVVATRRDGSGIGAAQCKCVEPDSLTVPLVRDSCREFRRHLKFWCPRGVKRFILVVAPDTSRTEIQIEYLRQRRWFAKLEIDFELWGASTVANKLRPQPGITTTYLGEVWRDVLCGTTMGTFPAGAAVVDSLLRAQLETLAGHVSAAAQGEVESLRGAWRRGRRAEAAAGVARLREASRWQAFSATVKAAILRFQSQLALEAGDLKTARELAEQAGALDPDANVRLLALIARAEGRSDAAVALLSDVRDAEGLTLRAALFLERGEIDEGIALLNAVGDHAEAHRLLALACILQRNLLRARLEVQKALQLSPDWHATLYTKAVVSYLSGLSAAMLTGTIPQWPEPEDWEFVKTDDESREYFRSAASLLEQLEEGAESNSEELRTYEAWHVACLSNDPERREEANAYARRTLTRDPAHYRVLAWALARRLDVDLENSAKVLRERLASGTATSSEVVALIVFLLATGDPRAASTLLETARHLFTGDDGDVLWRIWRVQLAAITGDESLAEAPVKAEDPPKLQLVAVRSRARLRGDWEPLIRELFDRAKIGDGEAAFELCGLLNSLGRSAEAVPMARTLVDRVGTAAALALACRTLFEGDDFSECLRQLDFHRALFPHSEFPAAMQRLRVAVQRELGLLSAATAEAEDLFRREPSVTNFRILSVLYFEKGDFPSLVVLARRHEQFQDISNADLLGLSVRLAAEDKAIAADLWRRAADRGFRDEEVPAALEIGFKLGLDRELRSLVLRLSGLGARSPELVRAMALEEIKSLLSARREEASRVYAKYTLGELPIHLVSNRLRRPLVTWYHRALLLNEASGRSVAGPTLTRSGWRTSRGRVVPSDVVPRLHADVTAVLTAFHLGILSTVERAFRPIVLPHRAIVALAEMRDAVRPVQPARGVALEAVRDLVISKRIGIAPSLTISEDVASRWNVDSRTAGMLIQANEDHWLVADFLPLAGKDGAAPHLDDSQEKLLTSVHCLVDSLYQLGQISRDQMASAIEVLGPEHSRPANCNIKRGAAVLCSAGVLELLAAAGVAADAVSAFSLFVQGEEFEVFVERELNAFKAGEEEASWLTSLLDWLNRGVDAGSYQVLPDLDHKAVAGDDVVDSLSFGCLLDLLTFPTAAGDVIWTDDRWLGNYSHRDGAAVVDTADVLEMLMERGAISEEERLRLIQRVRASDLRFWALDVEEVSARLRQADSRDGQLVETRELRTLRRHYAQMLADARWLRVSSGERAGQVEWTFLVSSSSAVLNTVAELWQTDAAGSESRLRAEWVLRNLYCPDRGRSFTTATRDADVDRSLEAAALSSLLSHPIRFPGHLREPRRRYFEWVYQRLLRRRFDADPLLCTATLEILKELLSQAVDSVRVEQANRPLAVALVRGLLADLPDEVSSLLAVDGEFLARLGASRSTVVRLGQHRVDADTMWQAAATALRTRAIVTFKTTGEADLAAKLLEGSERPELVIEDAPNRKQYIVLADSLGLLSDAVGEREATLRTLSPLFDLPREDAEAAVARIATLEGPSARVFEVAKLRRASLASHYRDLEEKLASQSPVLDESDLVPDDVDAMIRHLRLTHEGGPIDARLGKASETLVAEVGLQETIERLAGLPVALPRELIGAVRALGPADRRLLLKRLIRNLCSSPLGAGHVARLLSECADDSPSYRRCGRRIVRRGVFDAFGSRAAAWIEILRVCASDLSYVEAFRRLPPDIRLCLAWAVGDRICRLLLNRGVQAEWLRSHFGSWTNRLPAEVTYGDEEYVADVVYPRRIAALTFALAMASYVSQAGDVVGDELRAEFSEFIRSDPARLVAVMRDVGLSRDALGSLLCNETGSAWLSVLDAGLLEHVGPEPARVRLGAALDAIKSGEGDLPEWALIKSVVDDDPMPQELAERWRDALLATSLVSLHQKNRIAAVLAGIVASQHAGRVGDAPVSHLRSELLALARVLSQDSGEYREQARQMLLTSTFYLYARSRGTGDDGRFAQIARLLDELVQEWPQLADECQSLVDRLVDGLPGDDSRWLWQLQIKLRGLR